MPGINNALALRKRRHTSVRCENGKTIVKLYSTDIVVVDWAAETVTYNTGGHDTQLTVRRMQQAYDEIGGLGSRPPGLAQWRRMPVSSIVRMISPNAH